MNANGIAARIKLARKMAGLTTQAQLLAKIPEWKASRLGNYEAGISTPNPEDLRRIAEVTGTSPCWLTFGDGPIRPNERDVQAIRHQNLCHIVQERQEKRGALARLAKAMEWDKSGLLEHIDNPFLPIEDQNARQFESYLHVSIGWMDEQHVEYDPLCQSFPEDLRELMMLYSGLTQSDRRLILATIRTLSKELRKR